MTTKQIQQDAGQRYHNYLSLDTIRYRLSKGWDLDRVEQTKPYQQPRYFFKGHWYTIRGIQQIAHCNGVYLNDRSLRKRLNKGMPLSEAITLPANFNSVSSRQLFIYQGKKYLRATIIKKAKQQYQRFNYLDSEMALNMLALNLIDYAHEHDLTLSQLADKVMFGHMTIHNYIRRQRTPNLDTAIVIANRLGMTLNDLISIPDK